MEIPINQIGNFIAIAHVNGSRWKFTLHAAHVSVEDLDEMTVKELAKGAGYDTELLPSLFTYREILWQPNVFKESRQCLPAIRIFKAFCDEKAQEYELTKSKPNQIYSALLKGLSENCEKAVKDIEKKRQPESLNSIFKEFRKRCFPIIKFFIDHPQNRGNYHQEAMNRLNYAIKISIIDFHSHFTEFKEPFLRLHEEKPTDLKEKVVRKAKDVLID